MKINIFSFLIFFCVITLIGISGSEIFGQDVNLALNKKATQSSTAPWGDNTAEPGLAVDGKIDKIAESRWDDKNDWFEIDLENYYKINKIVIHARNDACCINQFHSVWLIITDQPLAATPMVDEQRISYSSTFAQFFKDPINGKREIEIGGKTGRYIRLQTKDSRIELQEVEVFGNPTPVAGHAPIPGKAWDAVLKMPFDPNYPNFLGTDQTTNPAYYGTLQGSPKIVVAKNSATSFDVAYQDLYGTGKTVRINTYDKNGAGFVKNAAESKNFEGLGTYAGFAKDAGKNRYVFTSESWTGFEQLVKAQVVKIPAQGNPDVIWNAKYYDGKSVVNGVKSLMNSFYSGTSRLVVGGNSLLITTNIFPAHPYQIILDTETKSKNDNRAFFESSWHHNFGQRVMYDGKDFVIMENRDHDVTVTLTKLNPSEVLPLTAKNEEHAGKYAARIFSVYSHTNFGNNTYTELGNVEKGFNDNDGYLVLFGGERDWDYKMNGYTEPPRSNWAPNILSPRDIGLVHVKKDFNKPDSVKPDKIMVNWLNQDGVWMTQCPPEVDTSKFVNSGGPTKTVKYKTANDGWNWVTYAPGSKCETISERSLITKGVNWVTNYGADYESKKAKAAGEFTSVNHPKLVRIAPNKYIAVWEEWTAKLGEPKSKYITTKAVTITLSDGSDANVNIQSSAIKDLGSKVRLMPGDDAFEFDGKAAWAVGDVTKSKLMFYTVDAGLNLASYELEL